ncbi:MAG: ATP-binding protein [Campylobacterota bacterium]|nr:ATP-binding protein [Campylobacterota bacterium]
MFAIYKAIVSKKQLEKAIKVEVEKNREIEKQLFQQSKQAQMGDMIANIAHQWRQPLSVISTSASGVQIEMDYNGVDKDKIYKAMDDIVKASNFLSNTIDTFRNFISSEEKPNDIVLQNRIDESIQIVEASLKNNYIELIKDIDYDAPIHSVLIAGELSQVLINIINNAKDAIKQRDIDEKWIKISLEKLNDKAVISIEDNGGGIPKDILAKIFDPYFTTKHQSQGTGLGLHMSYDIVTKHFNGNLYADNTKNGAIFYIEIPIVLE